MEIRETSSPCRLRTKSSCSDISLQFELFVFRLLLRVGWVQSRFYFDEGLAGILLESKDLIVDGLEDTSSTEERKWGRYIGAEDFGGYEYHVF